MREFMMLPLAAAFSVVLVGCSKPEPTDTVESLTANPERLKELRQQCKLDRAKLGDALCNRVAEATRRRFLGEGTTPYTPSEKPPKF
ncbi:MULTISPECIES: EexN family lipoprotein [Burkholderiales]|uniref:EexN family lipoprotein n=1 Tax=Burkholderiales TaxID=80840 RepID=UPI000CDA9772|nr:MULTISPECIES: EexN family lipoprotein [Burkholderiales]POR11484.1 entry exclusion lipoprotein TrbK [Diaphorobacter sp. LR2014-1]